MAYRARPLALRHPSRVGRVAHVADLDHRDGDVGHVQRAEVTADVETGAAGGVVRAGYAGADQRRPQGLRQPERGGRDVVRPGLAALGAMTWKPRPEDEAPSACSDTISRAPTLLPNFPRASTHGPQRLALLVVRVIRTTAPSASSRRLTSRESRKFTVASATPRLVAVPVVLHGLREAAGRHEPVDLPRVAAVAELVARVQRDGQAAERAGVGPRLCPLCHRGRAGRVGEARQRRTHQRDGQRHGQDPERAPHDRSPVAIRSTAASISSAACALAASPRPNGSGMS